MITIFAYETQQHFAEDLEAIKANKDHHMWFNLEDLDLNWAEAIEVADLSMSYFVALDMDCKIVREHVRKD